MAVSHLPETEETNAALKQSGFDMIDYLKDEDRYRIRLSTGDVQKGKAVLRALLKEAYVRRNGG